MKLVIIDRDGVLDAQGDDALAAPETWQPLPGALEAVARLNQAGWRVVLASDQSGLGRGLFEVSALNALHTRLHRALASVGARLDAIFYCPHGPEDGCHCRMPLAGLFEQIGERYGIELAGARRGRAARACAGRRRRRLPGTPHRPGRRRARPRGRAPPCAPRGVCRPPAVRAGACVVTLQS